MKVLVMRHGLPYRLIGYNVGLSKDTVMGDREGRCKV